MAPGNEEINAGTLIISEKPFVYVLSAKFRTENCDYCFLKGELHKCSNCHYVYYCNRNCQKEAWPVHKLECNLLKRITPRIIPDAARLLARLIKKLEKGGDTIKSYYAPNKYRTFKDLMSHYSDVKEDPRRMEHFVSLYGVLSEFLRDSFLPNTAELMGIYGRMCVNSFNISDEELRSLGTGIYLAASILDHSCQPNAVAIFQGTHLNIRTLEKMPSLKWGNIFLSYIDTLQLTTVRQEELLSTYYFLCQCPRCLNSEESVTMTAAACPNSDCNACIDIKGHTKNDVLKCDQCKTLVSSCFIQQYKDVTEFTGMHLQNMKLAYLDVCKVCLKQHKGVLHNLNIQHVRILDAAFESSIDFAQWDDAKQFGIELVPGYRKYLGEIHPLTGLLYLKLAKILIYQENLLEARNYLQRAYRILKITHGETSMLFKKEVISLIQENYSSFICMDESG